MKAGHQIEVSLPPGQGRRGSRRAPSARRAPGGGGGSDARRAPLPQGRTGGPSAPAPRSRRRVRAREDPAGARAHRFSHRARGRALRFGARGLGSPCAPRRAGRGAGGHVLRARQPGVRHGIRRVRRQGRRRRIRACRAAPPPRPLRALPPDRTMTASPRFPRSKSRTPRTAACPPCVGCSAHRPCSSTSATIRSTGPECPLLSARRLRRRPDARQ